MEIFDMLRRRIRKSRLLCLKSYEYNVVLTRNDCHVTCSCRRVRSVTNLNEDRTAGNKEKSIPSIPDGVQDLGMFGP